MVDPVDEPRLACGIGADQAVEVERAAIGQDQPRPDHQRARLAVADMGIVAADQSRALRDQLGAAGRGVEHVLGHLRDHLSRQIGRQASDQCGGDRGTCDQHIPSSWRRQSTAVDGRGSSAAHDERCLAILGVLGVRWGGGRQRVRRRWGRYCRRISSLRRLSRFAGGCEQLARACALALLPLTLNGSGLLVVGCALRRHPRRGCCRSIGGGTARLGHRRRRPQSGPLPLRDGTIILWRGCEQVVGPAVIDRYRLLGRSVVAAGAERKNQRRRQPDRAAARKKRDGPSRKPPWARCRGASGDRGGSFRRADSLLGHVGIVIVDHDRRSCPRVRSMRTICCLLVPSRSSAIANSRSTTM